MMNNIMHPQDYGHLKS